MISRTRYASVCGHLEDKIVHILKPLDGLQQFTQEAVKQLNHIRIIHIDSMSIFELMNPRIAIR